MAKDFFNLPKINIYGNSLKKGNLNRDSRRSFSSTQKKEILYQQNNKCAKCHKPLDPREIEFDHITPWADRGKTIVVNGRALCGKCHKIVSHETRLKKVDKKRKNNRSKDKNYMIDPITGEKTKLDF